MFKFLKRLTKSGKAAESNEENSAPQPSSETPKIIRPKNPEGIIKPKASPASQAKASHPGETKSQHHQKSPPTKKAAVEKPTEAKNIAPKPVKMPEVGSTDVSTTFAALGLESNLLQAVEEEGYSHPTPIQKLAIPVVLRGSDLFGCAQTGTGKTAAFALPILQRLQAEERAQHKKLRALVLAPTRELALQIYDNFVAYSKHSKLSATVIFGGVGQQPQVQKLQKRPDILIATTGRLLDLINQGYIDLSACTYLVLDEADKMLDMGFIHDIKKIIKLLPKQRQTLFFSATMPKEIKSLANEILHDPEEVSVTPVATTAERVDQKVFFVGRNNKTKLLEHLLTSDTAMQKVLVFARTKRGANKLAETLNGAGFKSAAIHGNKTQSARQKALDQFRAGRIRVLVASDLAARGLDLEDISHVINYDLPEVPETYVHRIGRTGRAHASGIALTFCSGAERSYFVQIERVTKAQITIVADHPYVETAAEAAEAPYVHNQRGQNQGRRPQPRKNSSQGGGTKRPQQRRPKAAPSGN